MLSLDTTGHRGVALGVFQRLTSNLPTICWPAAWAAACLVGTLLGQTRPWTLAGVPVAMVARVPAVLLLLGPVQGQRPLRIACLLLLTALAAAGAGGLLAGTAVRQEVATAPTPWSPSTAVGSAGLAVGRVGAAPRVTVAGRWSAPLLTVAWQADGEEALRQRSGGVLLRGQDAAPAVGAVIVVRGRLRPARSASVPDGFAEARWLAGRDVAAVLSVDGWCLADTSDPLAAVRGRLDSVRRILRRTCERGLPPSEAAIARAVLLGDGLDRDRRGDFVALGLAHLFALSGLHVGILAGLVFGLLSPVPVSGPTRGLLVLPLLLCYAVMVDLPGSVVRAAGLVSLALLARVAGRAGDTLRALGLLCWLNLLWQPWFLVDVGSQLSYLAAGGILAGSRILGDPTGRMGRLVSAVGVTVSAQVATLPVIAGAFGAVPLAGPLLNLLVVPAFGATVSLLAIGLLVSGAWPWAGDGLLAVAATLLRLMEAGANLGQVQGVGATMGTASWGAGRIVVWLALLVLLAVAVASRRRRPWLVIGAIAYTGLLLLVLVPAPAADGPVVWQFAVGQGDAALLAFPDGWRAMIDTGDSGWRGRGPVLRDVVPWLQRQRITALDAVILTHDHGDHTGGAVGLAESVDVKRWYVGDGVSPPASGAVVRPVAGDTLHAHGGWALVCLHPGPEDPPTSCVNDQSVVVGLCRDGLLRGLWTGDLERAGEARLLPRMPPVPAMGLDVWKAGHHGSATSGGPDLLAQVRPRLVVISTGVANRHHHPSHGPFVARGDTLPILRTDLHGTIALRWRRDELIAVPMRSP